MLSMMISGPRQPGNDIDVYLSPLIEDLRKLWDEGVLVFDGFRMETFQMRETAPILLTGKKVFQRLEHLNSVFGKTQKKDKSKTCMWKKRSIFFDLPYWSDLDIRHCIDVMHVEKNVCDSVIGTLLNIQDKTKDDLNTRQDLADMRI